MTYSIEQFYRFFQGALIFQIIFFGLIYFSTRRKDVLWYTFYLLTAAFYFFINAGGTFFNLDENSIFQSSWYNWVNIPVIILENLFYLLFIRCFFSDIVSVKIKKGFYFMFLLIPFLCITFLFLKFGDTDTQSIFYTVKLLSILPAILIVITIIKNKLQYGGLVATGLVFTILGTVVTVFMIILRNNNVHTIFTDGFPLFFIRCGLLGDMFFYQLAILKKWRSQEKELAIQKIQTELAVEKIRTQISRELHDDIGSTLSGINMYSHIALQQASESNTNSITQSLITIQQSTQHLIRRLKDIVWLLHTGADGVSDLSEKIQEYAAYMCDAKEIVLNTIVEPDLAKKKITKEKGHQLFMIAKEAINNAVKHSNATLLNINFTTNNNQLILSISDNGNGFDENIITNGNGLTNMHNRAKEIGAQLKINSLTKRGTELTLAI